MIGKVLRGSRVGGLLHYLYGPGRSNEHQDPHLVGSWDDNPDLLEPSRGHDGKPDLEISALLHTGLRTVERTRQKFVLGGLEFSLTERSRAGRFPKIDDKVETILTTLAQSKPPAGRVRWTLQLLADRLVTLTHLESLSYETVRLVLKKTILNLGSAKSGAFQP